MPVCKACGEEVDELVAVKRNGRPKKLCEECAEDVSHDAQIAEESEAAIQQMMGFQGRR